MMALFHDPLEINATREDKLSALAENYHNLKNQGHYGLLTPIIDKSSMRRHQRNVIRARRRCIKESVKYGIADYLPGYLGRMVGLANGSCIYV